jgi:hypothetical protein
MVKDTRTRGRIKHISNLEIMENFYGERTDLVWIK